jgi:hypothetical protein
MNKIVSAITTSKTSIISTICKIVFNYVTSSLPSDYIKKKFIVDGNFTIQTYYKKKDYHSNLPAMIIAPNFNISPPEFDGNIGFSENIVLSPLNGYLNINDFYLSRLPFILYDTDNGVSIRFSDKRFKIDFNSIIKIESPLQASNLLNILRMKLYENKPFFLNQIDVPIHLSTNLIFEICKNLNLDIKNSDDLEKLNDYFKLHSKYQIESTLNKSTGNVTFFMIVKRNLLMKFSDFNLNINKVNKVHDRCSITFSSSIELAIPDIFITELDNTIEPLDMSDSSIIVEEGDLISFSFAIVKQIPTSLDFNKSLIFKQSFLTENNLVMENIDLSNVIPTNLKDLLFNSDDLYISQNFKFKIVDEKNVYIDDSSFEFNRKNYLLSILSEQNFTYNFLIYATKEIVEKVYNKNINFENFI